MKRLQGVGLALLLAVTSATAAAGVEVSFTGEGFFVFEGGPGSGGTLVFTLYALEPMAPTAGAPQVRYPVTLNFTTVDGSATIADNDYVPQTMGSMTLTGNGDFTIEVAVNGDNKQEPDESMTLMLLPSAGIQFPQGDSAFGGIDNDDTSSLSVGDAAVTEGDSGSVQAIFDVTLDNPSSEPVTTGYFTGEAEDPNSATEGVDFAGILEGLLTFSPGVVSQTVAVTVFGDAEMEPDEVFEVILTGAGGAEIADGLGTGTILNDDFPELSISDAEVTEGDAGQVQAEFTVTLSEPQEGEVTVDYATSDDGALAGTDYDAASGTATIAPGLTETTISVAVNGDTLVEGNEQFLVTLSNPSGGVMIVDGEGVGTILDDDMATLSIDDVTVTEGDAGLVEAEFTVSLSLPSAGTVTVDFTTTDGSATAASGDYIALAGEIALPPGSTSFTLAIEVGGDTLVEVDETFTVDLSNPDGATLADDQGVGTITNDDGTTLTIGDVGLAEGDAGGRPATFVVTLSEPSDLPVSVSWATRDGTATVAGGDYRAAAGSLSFPPGEQRRTLEVTVVGDTLLEPDETFFVDLSEPAGATIADGEGAATIADDDAATLAIGDVTLAEGNAGTTSAEFPVTLSAPSSTPVSVSFATRNGTATAGSDYQATSGVLTLPPGVTAATIAVPVIGDTTLEPDETFFVSLSGAVGAGLGDAEGRGTVLNDDEETRIRIASAPDVDEGAGSVEVVVERIGGGDSETSCTISTVDGSADSPEDFFLPPTTLTWAPGDGEPKVVEIAIIGDNIAERTEVFRVRLTQPVGGTLGTPQTARIRILDDDVASSLEAQGDSELSATAGDEVELEVVARSEGGDPVAGVPVTWEVIEGDAELGDESAATAVAAEAAATTVTPTDAEGVSAQTVRLGAAGRVVVEARAGEAAARFEISVEGGLGDLFNSRSQPAQSSVADAVDEACAEEPGGFDEACDYLAGLPPEEQVEAINALTPTQTPAQIDSTRQAPHIQRSTLQTRLASGRAGGSSNSMSGLSVSLRGEAIAVGRLASALLQSDGEQQFAASLDRALSFGGMSDESEPSVSVAAEIDEESRFAFFLSGQVEMGDRPGTTLEDGFDFSTRGLTAGVDYRFTKAILGVALGYVSNESDFDRGGDLESSGLSLSLFATRFGERLWGDAIVSYGVNDYDQRRVFELPQPLAGRTRFTAVASPEGTQTLLGLGGGYDGALGSATATGFGRVTWVETTIDSYTESGAAPFDLTIRQQSVDSLLAEAGVELSWALSRSWGVLQPVVRGAVFHEFEDDARLVRGLFAADPGGNEFQVPTEAPDRDYFNVGVGLTATFARGRGAYFLYETDLARDDLELYRLTGGLRLEF